MYKTFEEAKAAAMNVINKKYDGFNNGCVVTESKKSIRSRTVPTGRLYKATLNDLRDAAINAKSVIMNESDVKHVVYAIEDGGWIYASEYTPFVFMTDEEFEEYVKDAQKNGVGMIYAIHKI